MSTILLVVLGIGFLIFIHEGGHYLCARMAGVHVQVFSLGFGPRLFGFVVGGTDYRICAVPVGGYVRVLGEDPVADRDYMPPDGLHSKSFSQRVLFFSGGVAMNVLFALIVFPIVFRAGVPFVAPVVGAVLPGSPAWEAGIEPGDRIVALGDRERVRSMEVVIQDVALAADDPLTISIERGDQRFDLEVTPRYQTRTGLYEMGIDRSIRDAPLPVTEVDAGSPAAKAGLRAGDLLLALGGTKATGQAMIDLIDESSSRVGQTVTLLVRGEDGEERTIEYLPDSRSEPPRIGVRLASRTVLGQRPGVPSLERLGLRRGDRIVDVEGSPFLGNGVEPMVAATADGRLEITVLREEARVPLSAEFTASDAARLADHLALGNDLTDLGLIPVDDSQAATAGILPGDVLVRIDGTEADDFADLQAAVEGAGEGEALKFQLRRPGTDQPVEVSVTPARGKAVELGFNASAEVLKTRFQVETVSAAIAEGFHASVDMIRTMYLTLKRLFTGEVSARNLGGIITISRVSHHYANQGLLELLYFLSLLSLNLAFVNFLPIPVLDGGHVMFLIIEKVKGSPISERVFNYSQLMGLAFVLALMVFVTYNDVVRLLAGR